MKLWPNILAVVVMLVIGVVQIGYPERLLELQRKMTPSLLRMKQSPSQREWYIVGIRVSGCLCLVGSLIAALTLLPGAQE